ncbi:MAG: Mu transposase domain-containing protein, partial [Eubacteriales bacterium]
SKCHSTTGKIPILHLEKDFLSKLPTARIRNLYSIILPDVTVNPHSLIHYISNLYSVPPEYIGKKVKIQKYDAQLHICYNTDLITIHSIKNQKLNYHHNHYVAISSLTLKKHIEDIETIAKNNLKMIGAVYQND